MPIKRIPFDELLPDQPFVGETNGMAEAVNVLPLDGRWRPVKKSVLAAVGSTGTAGQVAAALYSHVRDRVIVGTVTLPSFGVPPDARLMEVDEGGGSFVAVDAGGYASGIPVGWSFCEFDAWFIATDGLDPVMYIDATAVAFANLITSATVPKARFCATAKTHLVLAWVTEGGTDFSRRVWWSAQGDPQNFEPGSARAGFVDLATAGGEITGIVGGEEFFIVFTESKVVLFEYVGGDQVWFPREIANGPEALAPVAQHSIVKRGGGVYYRGRDGYKEIVGGSVGNVGEGKIRSYVRELDSVVPVPGAVDQVNGLAVWVGEVGLEGGELQGTILVWNPTEDRFSTVTLIDGSGNPLSIATNHVFPAYAPGGGDTDNLNNVMFLLQRPLPDAVLWALRLNAADYAAWRMKSRLIEPVPGETGTLSRLRPIIELEEGTGKAVPQVTVEVRLWNDLWKKTQAGGSPFTIDSDTDLDADGWATAGFPVVAARFEFILAGAEVDGATEYVPINILGVDADFEVFSED